VAVKKTVLSKIKQLENDCMICLAKMPSRSDIRNVVAVAVIVNSHDYVDDFFKELQKKATLYPNLYQLFLSGRLIYIIYTETHIAMLRDLTQVVYENRAQLAQLQTQNDRLQSQNDRLQSQNDRLQSQLSENNSLMRELLTLVKGKSENI
jgi:cell division protein FtsB